MAGRSGSEGMARAARLFYTISLLPQSAAFPSLGGDYGSRSHPARIQEGDQPLRPGSALSCGVSASCAAGGELPEERQPWVLQGPHPCAQLSAGAWQCAAPQGWVEVSCAHAKQIQALGRLITVLAVSRCPPKPCAVTGGAFRRWLGLEYVMLGSRMCHWDSECECYLPWGWGSLVRYKGQIRLPFCCLLPALPPAMPPGRGASQLWSETSIHRELHKPFLL